MIKKLPLLAACAILFVGQSAKAELYITQYYEGASNNKFIELTNLGLAAIDFSTTAYYLGTWSNANRDAWTLGTAPTNTVLLNTGTLASGATLLLMNSSATAPTYATATATSISGFGLSFNGDDSVGLWTGSATYSTSILVDMLGVSATIISDVSVVRTAIGAVQTSGYATLAALNASGMWTSGAFATADSASAGTNEYLGFSTLTPVPEPHEYALAVAGLLGVVVFMRRRKAAQVF